MPRPIDELKKKHEHEIFELRLKCPHTQKVTEHFIYNNHPGDIKRCTECDQLFNVTGEPLNRCNVSRTSND